MKTFLLIRVNYPVFGFARVVLVNNQTGYVKIFLGLTLKLVKSVTLRDKIKF